MRKNKGFTLIELIIFIVVLSIVSGMLITGASYALKYTPLEHNQTIAINKSANCMEYFLGQRIINNTGPFTYNTTNKNRFCSNEDGFETTLSKEETIQLTGFTGKFKLLTVETKKDGKTLSKLELIVADY